LRNVTRLDESWPDGNTTLRVSTMLWRITLDDCQFAPAGHDTVAPRNVQFVTVVVVATCAAGSMTPPVTVSDVRVTVLRVMRASSIRIGPVKSAAVARNRLLAKAPPGSHATVPTELESTLTRLPDAEKSVSASTVAADETTTVELTRADVAVNDTAAARDALWTLTMQPCRSRLAMEMPPVTVLLAVTMRDERVDVPLGHVSEAVMVLALMVVVTPSV